MCCLAEIKVDQWQEKNGGKIWNILFGGRRGRLTYTGHRLWSSTWPIRTRWLAICSWTRQSPKTRPADWKTAKRSNWVGVKWAKRGHFRRLRWPAPLPPPWSVHRLNRPMKCDPQTATSAPISRPRHSTKHTRIGAPTHRTAGDANPRLTNCYDCSVCVSVCVFCCSVSAFGTRLHKVTRQGNKTQANAPPTGWPPVIFVKPVAAHWQRRTVSQKEKIISLRQKEYKRWRY